LGFTSSGDHGCPPVIGLSWSTSAGGGRPTRGAPAVMLPPLGFVETRASTVRVFFASLVHGGRREFSMPLGPRLVSPRSRVFFFVGFCSSCVVFFVCGVHFRRFLLLRAWCSSAPAVVFIVSGFASSGRGLAPWFSRLLCASLARGCSPPFGLRGELVVLLFSVSPVIVSGDVIPRRGGFLGACVLWWVVSCTGKKRKEKGTSSAFWWFLRMWWWFRRSSWWFDDDGGGDGRGDGHDEGSPLRERGDADEGVVAPDAGLDVFRAADVPSLARRPAPPWLPSRRVGPVPGSGYQDRLLFRRRCVARW
ncbi:hypothetical protein Dimus_035734, partial [Dionaea muscipula]